MTKRVLRYSPELRERATGMVFDQPHEHGSQSAAINAIAAKIGCSGEALRNGIRPFERGQGRRARPTTDEREPIKALDPSRASG